MTMNTTHLCKPNPAADSNFDSPCRTKGSGQNNVPRKQPLAPRILPVQFELPGGPVISAFAHNLSLQGMQVHCDLARIKDFVAGTKGMSDIPVLVVMRLQVGNRLSSQVLRCRLCYQQKLQAGEMVLGLEFDSLLPDQRQALLNVMLQTQDSTVRN